MSGTRVLLLADAALGPALGEALRAHGFRVETTAAADAALVLAGGIGFDVAVVDRAMLGTRASALIKRLRGVLSAPLCLLVSGRPAAGPAADAVLAKPVRVPALAAAVRELAGGRRNPRIGAFEFRAAARTLYDAAKRAETRLTEIETALLDSLHKAGGRPLAREDLLRAVWGYNSKVSTRTLETHVYRLRQKIERDPARARLLLTVPGGYRLVVPRGKDQSR
ncbi:MAG: response regulator transcription factor [Rhodospirillales bacterium]|nr:response regulator transcription factor [Rhodospirillales bacterium]